VRFTLQLPTDRVYAASEFVTGAAIAEMARCAEEAGFDACFVTEHPFPSDRWLQSGGHHALDPYVALSFAAAATTRIRVQTNIAVLAYRNPFLTAKAVASLDVLSGGRVTLGVAAGYQRGEFDALGVDFEERNELADEALYRPRPIQQPHPPIWVGGTGRGRLLPIAGRHADVWHGWADTPGELAEMNAIVDRAAEVAGRDPSEVVRASSLSISEPWDEVRRTFEWLRDGGVSYLAVEWPSEGKGRLEDFVEQVLPELS